MRVTTSEQEEQKRERKDTKKNNNKDWNGRGRKENNSNVMEQEQKEKQRREITGEAEMRKARQMRVSVDVSERADQKGIIRRKDRVLLLSFCCFFLPVSSTTCVCVRTRSQAGPSNHGSRGNGKNVRQLLIN